MCVKLLDTPAELGFDKVQTVSVWTHQNIRARKVYGHSLGNLKDPDEGRVHASGIESEDADHTVSVDAVLVHFQTARINGRVYMTSIVNPENDWTVSLGVTPTTEPILPGFQLNQEQLKKYHEHFIFF